MRDDAPHYPLFVPWLKRSLKRSGWPDGDGSGTVKISVPASELAKVAHLLAYREQALKITIQPQT